MTSPKQRYQLLILTTQAFISVGRSSSVKILKAIKYAESIRDKKPLLSLNVNDPHFHFQLVNLYCVLPQWSDNSGTGRFVQQG